VIEGGEAGLGVLPVALINQCVLSRRPLLVPDAANNAAYKADAFIQSQAVKSLLCFPVMYKGTCQSLLLLTHHQQSEAFTRKDLRFLSSLAPQFAVSLENAQLYQAHHQFHESLEQKVEQRTHELKAANEELEAFTASASHDLGAPLRAIAGFTEALAEDFTEDLGEAGQNYANLLVQESGNMREIMEGLIALSRSTQGGVRWEEVNLSTLVDDKLRWLRTMDTEHVIEDHVQQGLTANGDLRLIKQVVDNLITNAWKYSYKVSEPSLGFGMITTDESLHTFYVQDNGVGFDAANAKELFAPFRRFHSSAEFEGTGIGLATVYRVVKRHGGKIWIESAVNQGATVYFTLD